MPPLRPQRKQGKAGGRPESVRKGLRARLARRSAPRVGRGSCPVRGVPARPGQRVGRQGRPLPGRGQDRGAAREGRGAVPSEVLPRDGPSPGSGAQQRQEHQSRAKGPEEPLLSRAPHTGRRPAPPSRSPARLSDGQAKGSRLERARRRRPERSCFCAAAGRPQGWTTAPVELRPRPVGPTAPREQSPSPRARRHRLPSPV